MAPSTTQSRLAAVLEENVICPYCQENTAILPAANYRPIFVVCRVCGKQFIAERMKKGIQVLKVEGAPCCSDPDRRAIETGLGDED